MQNAWDLMNEDEFGSTKLLKSKYWRGDQIIQTFFKIGSPQKLGPPPHLFLDILRVWEQYSWIMQNAFKSNEWQWIWVYKTFKIEIQNGGTNNSDLLQNWLPPEIRSPLFNL